MLFRTLSIPVILIALPILGYVAICVMLFFRQDKMIFFPSKHAPGEFDGLARMVGFEPWLDDSGTQLGWKKTRPDAEKLILACHGNGGSAVDRFELAPLLEKGSEANLYLLEYPGYGARSGKPSETSLVDSAVDAMDRLKSAHPGVPLWLFGESLGTGVVSAAAAKRPSLVSGIILITPFDSLVGAAQRLYPWLPVEAMVLHRFDSVRHLNGIKAPVAIVIAGRDTTTPPVLGYRLAEQLTMPHRVWMVPDAGHNDTQDLLAQWPEIDEWLDAASASGGNHL